MAAAQVSGAAALILSTAQMSTTALRADILKSVDVLPALAGECEPAAGSTSAGRSQRARTAVGLRGSSVGR